MLFQPYIFYNQYIVFNKKKPVPLPLHLLPVGGESSTWKEVNTSPVVDKVKPKRWFKNSLQIN